MSDYNSMKADEYARRQGEMDEFDNAVDEMFDVVASELPSWISECGELDIAILINKEAKHRVMQVIKERNEP